ncbi:MAG: nitroreductase family protein [Betaproteobacteria bacterium]|nr:nitroreductase family protein [Betaproteobacteria bacterium]
MTNDISQRIERALEERFGTAIPVAADQPGSESLARLLEHRSHRKYLPQPVNPELLQLLFACALSSPSKSDLQQADIVHVADAAKRKLIADLIPDMPWVREAPVFLVFCGNNRRIRQVAELRGKPFANDHLDAFMNAAVDAGIVMTTFMLALPDWVFPVAGLCAGYPAGRGVVTPRLPLGVTVHTDRFDETGIVDKIEGYDRRRAARQPYAKQRGIERYGKAEFYGWSEDKARQYSVVQRADFGAFIRGKRFNLT